MKSFKEIKALLENRYMVKFEKGGSMRVREYEASSEMAAHSKASVDAKRMGMSVASVRLKEVEKKTKDSPAMEESTQVDEAHQEVSADYKVTPSGRKVPAQRKVVKDEEDEKVNESVSVKKQDYSWGKMVTVHHGSENSYPLHPEHQKKIASLKDGEHTSFTDETNRKVSAQREGDKVHLSGAGSNKKTTVAHSHFTESVDLEEAYDKQEMRFLQLARIGLVNKSDVSKLRMAMDQLKADKQLTLAQRSLIFSVFQNLADLVTGDDAIFQRVRMDIQKESKTNNEAQSVCESNKTIFSKIRMLNKKLIESKITK